MLSISKSIPGTSPRRAIFFMPFLPKIYGAESPKAATLGQSGMDCDSSPHFFYWVIGRGYSL